MGRVTFFVWVVLKSVLSKSRKQSSRIAAIHGIIAAVAEEVHVAGVEAARIHLEEAAEAGVIHPVPVIVDA